MLDFRSGWVKNWRRRWRGFLFQTLIHWLITRIRLLSLFTNNLNLWTGFANHFITYLGLVHLTVQAVPLWLCRKGKQGTWSWWNQGLFILIRLVFMNKFQFPMVNSTQSTTRKYNLWFHYSTYFQLATNLRSLFLLLLLMLPSIKVILHDSRYLHYLSTSEICY